MKLKKRIHFFWLPVRNNLWQTQQRGRIGKSDPTPFMPDRLHKIWIAGN